MPTKRIGTGCCRAAEAAVQQMFLSDDDSSRVARRRQNRGVIERFDRVHVEHARLLA